MVCRKKNVTFIDRVLQKPLQIVVMLTQTQNVMCVKEEEEETQRWYIQRELKVH